MHQTEVKKMPSVFTARWFECNELYKRCETPNTEHISVQNTSNVPAYQFHLYTLEASLFLHFSHILLSNTHEERERGRQTLSAITFCAPKTNRTNHMSILSTTQRITHNHTNTLFSQEALRIIIYSGQQRNEQEKTVSSNKKSQNTESNCLRYNTTQKKTNTVSIKYID